MYYSNNEFYQPGGPIFIFVGSYGGAEPLYILYGLMYDIANETNGMMFATDHRFYGTLYPTTE